MKKFISIVLVIILIFSFCGCSRATPINEDGAVKIGLICLHDEQSTYDLNFINGFKNACEKTNTPYIIKTNIPEGQECYVAAVDLIDEGCNIVFADSFGHEDYLIEAAKEYPNVQFCHATGTKAHTENLPNYHNAFASIYEGRFLTGVAAGMKLNQMIKEGWIKEKDAVIGYVGAFPYAEVISGYTSFFLGARYVCPTVSMIVDYTGSWYDEALEREAALHLIESGCVLISQHADSMGAPGACEDTGVPNVSYNGSTINVAPNTFIISSRINWEPYFEYIIKCVNNKEQIDTDWTGTIQSGSVLLTEINKNVAAPGTEEELAEIKQALEKGLIHVFDIRTFTVDQRVIRAYKADVDSDSNYTGDTEAISDGYFHESEYRSAPYFDLLIDGIRINGENSKTESKPSTVIVDGVEINTDPNAFVGFDRDPYLD